MQEKLNYSVNMRYIINENKVVLANRKTGEWIRISKECFEILNSAIDNSMTKNELFDCLADGEDRLYFKDLLDKLEIMHIISDETPTREIETIYLIVTNRCNLKCKHCCVNADNIDSKIVKQEMSTDVVKSVIDKLIVCAPTRIILTGGEPMIREDFFTILAYLRENYSGEIRLATNALLINENNVQEIVRCINQIDISIDGIDEASCSLVRGKGVFGRVIKAIHLLKKTGLNKISLSMVFGDYNNNLEDQFEKLNEELGTYPVKRIFTLLGRGESNASMFLDSKRDNKSIANANEIIQQTRQNAVCVNCSAGITNYVINYDGNVFPCSNLMQNKYILFNINEIEDFKLYIETELRNTIGYETFRELQPENYEKCKTCKVNLFCWQCLQDIEYLRDKPDKFNIRCDKKKSILYSAIWGE